MTSTNPPQKSKAKKFLGNILLSLSIFLFLLTGFEIYLRIADIQGDNFFTHHPVLGWVHKPNFKGKIISKEFNVTKTTNKHGFFGKDYPYKKSPNTYRIVILGDSITESMQVKDEAVFTNLLEKQLNGASESIKYEIINLGVKSYGTAKELYLLEKHGLKYQPDLIILAFFIGNDVYNNISENINPQARFSKKEQLTNYLKTSLRNHFAFWRFYKEHKGNNRLLNYFRKTRFSLDQTQSLYQAQYSSQLKAGFIKTKKLIKNIRNLSNEHKAQALIVLFPEKSQIYKQFRSVPDRQLNFSKPNNLLVSFFKEEAITFLDLLPPFLDWDRLNKKDLLYFPIDGHINEIGHQLVTEQLFNYLKINHGL